mmetsp:Transcript_23413/g.69276  ORF Transcript_23413/g.69276 Transcript_23413/m.69276 type:complete len:256 (-) Transcript_23413:6257-7024(-)
MQSVLDAQGIPQVVVRELGEEGTVHGSLPEGVIVLRQSKGQQPPYDVLDGPVVQMGLFAEGSRDEIHVGSRRCNLSATRIRRLDTIGSVVSMRDRRHDCILRRYLLHRADHVEGAEVRHGHGHEAEFHHGLGGFHELGRLLLLDLGGTAVPLLTCRRCVGSATGRGTLRWRQSVVAQHGVPLILLLPSNLSQLTLLRLQQNDQFSFERLEFLVLRLSGPSQIAQLRFEGFQAVLAVGDLGEGRAELLIETYLLLS